MPDEAEAHALLALTLLGHARSAARFLGGERVLLDDQDRALWDQNQIDEGRQRLERALTLHGSGPYTIQAAITDLLGRLGRDGEARAAYTRALKLTQPGPEQRFLESRLADLWESAEQQSDPQSSAY
jgi:RNA polymerase sigma-70 factor, ECF subfamily